MLALSAILNVLVLIVSLSPNEAASTMTSETNGKIDAELLKQFQDAPGAKITMKVEMKDSTKEVLDEFNKQTFASREERLNGLNKVLTDFTQKSQKNVLEFLEKEKAKPNGGFTYESMWINNSIIIRQGDLQLVEDLAKFPEVSGIRAEKKIDLH